MNNVFTRKFFLIISPILILVVGSDASQLHAESVNVFEKTLRDSTSKISDSKNVASLLDSAGNFKTFLGLVELAGLTPLLEGKKTETASVQVVYQGVGGDTSTVVPGITVLAPTDAAFEMLPKTTLDSLKKDKSTLNEFVRRHIINKRCNAIFTLKSVSAMDGSLLTTKVTDDGFFTINDAVLGVPIMGSNGIIHSLNQALLKKP